MEPGLYKAHGGHFLIVASVARKYVRIIRIAAGELQLRKDTWQKLTAERFEPCAEVSLCSAIDRFLSHPGGVSDAAKSALLNLKEINMEVNTASTAELVAFYNKHSEKPIKKFADRATAEKRCQAILDDIKNKNQTAHKMASDKKPPASKRDTDKQLKSACTVVVIDGKGKRSEPEWHRSVLKAFETHGLPINKHKEFRKELKKSGRNVFDLGDGRKYEFAV